MSLQGNKTDEGKALLGVIVILALLAAIAYSSAHADTRQFCSPTAITATNSQTPNGYQETLASSGTIVDGVCVVPPPVGCTKAPVVQGVNGKNFQRTTATVGGTYFAFGSKQVDLTQYASWFPERVCFKDAAGNIIAGTCKLVDRPFPSGYNSQPVIPLPPTTYASFEFTVPTNYIPPGVVWQSLWQVNPSSFTAAFAMTVSTSCGDFGQLKPTTILPGCSANNLIGGAKKIGWSTVDYLTGTCEIKNGQTLYLNVITADISELPTGGVAKSTATTQCTYAGNGAPTGGNNCSIAVQNGPGNWPH
jgi:hypothetical protein